MRVSDERFEVFYEEAYGRVFRASWAFCGDRDIAQDAAQDAFAKAYSRWKRVSRMNSPVGWVIVTAQNFCRKQAASRTVLSDSQDTPSSRDELTSFETRSDLLRVIRTLSSRQQQAVVLHYLEDVSITDTAEVMGLSEGGVKAHLARGREQLRNAYEFDEPPVRSRPGSES
jgi:RNA polymerase sigma-70 factor, ECF subfamily